MTIETIEGLIQFGLFAREYWPVREGVRVSMWPTASGGFFFPEAVEVIDPFVEQPEPIMLDVGTLHPREEFIRLERFGIRVEGRVLLMLDAAYSPRLNRIFVRMRPEQDH